MPLLKNSHTKVLSVLSTESRTETGRIKVDKSMTKQNPFSWDFNSNDIFVENFYSKYSFRIQILRS
jgi:hypothetical protein